MGKIIITGYRPQKPDHTKQLKKLLKTHQRRLKDEGFITSRSPLMLESCDGTVIEVMEWKSAGKIEAWKGHASLQMERDKIASICDFVPFGNIVEAQRQFAEFSVKDSPEEKGFRFEEYVVRQIAVVCREGGRPIYFTDWRGDKHIPNIGMYPQSNSKPDLEFVKHYTGLSGQPDTEKKFGFECKWRSGWEQENDESERIIKWIKEEWKLKKYAQDACEKNRQVYIVLGIGWHEDKEEPSKVYLIPFESVSNGVIKESVVEPFLSHSLIDTVRSVLRPSNDM